MSWFEHDGGRVYYEIEGAGEALLILPGWGGSIDEFAALRRELAQTNKVIAADLPGSGRSGPQPREYVPGYFNEDAAAMLGLIDELNVAPVTLVGFSDGGEDALLMAILRPSVVKAVITWGAAGRLEAPPQMLEAFAALIDKPIPPLKGFSDYLKTAYGEETARAMVRSEAAALTTMIEAGGDITFSRANDIGCPVLLITGEHDPFAPPPLVEAMAKAIPGSKFVEAKGAGHDVHIARPEWLAQVLMDWLARRE